MESSTARRTLVSSTPTTLARQMPGTGKGGSLQGGRMGKTRRADVEASAWTRDAPRSSQRFVVRRGRLSRQRDSFVSVSIWTHAPRSEEHTSELQSRENLV